MGGELVGCGYGKGVVWERANRRREAEETGRRGKGRGGKGGEV